MNVELRRLAVAHGCADACQGAVPALLPLLITERGLGLTAAASLVSVASIGSSLVQPLFGLWSDRLSRGLLVPAGVLLGSLGLGLVGVCHSYAALAAALGLSGLGVALFHPEAARRASLAAGGTARGMSWFSIGGNAGFAAGPLLVLLVIAAGGLDAAPLLAVPGVLVTLLLLRRRPARGSSAPGRARAADPSAPMRWRAFAPLVGAAVARTAAFFSLQALVPIYLVLHFGRGPQLGAAALAAMLAAGAIGTLIGGRCADHYGRRPVVVAAMPLLLLVLILLPLAPFWAFLVLLLVVGFAVEVPFSTTVVLGQEYLPARPALASGITLGLAIGLGGLLAAAVGALADATSLTAGLAVLPLFALAALAFAWRLPVEGERSPSTSPIAGTVRATLTVEPGAPPRQFKWEAGAGRAK